MKIAVENGTPLPAFGGPHLAGCPRLLGDVAHLVEVGGKQLGDRVRVEVDPKPVDVEPHGPGLGDKRVSGIELSPPNHQALTQAA